MTRGVCDSPIVVIDCGGQYAHLITRRIRDLGAYAVLNPHTATAADISQLDPCGIIVSGGPSSVHEAGAPSIDPDILELGIPLLGICYGMQLIAQMSGGTVERTDTGEYGRTALVTHSSDRLPALNDSSSVWMSHRDAVVSLPSNFIATCSTDTTPIAAFEATDKSIFGLQFHPEVRHTEHGQKLLEQFVFTISCAPDTWHADEFIQQALQSIREQIGDGRALCALSGGVDSAVAAMLMHQAIGDRLTCVFVDHGLLRQGEADDVVAVFGERFSTKLVHVNVRDLFMQHLAGVDDPEAKRTIIGEHFIRTFEHAAREHQGSGDPFTHLVQGTLYSDVIESGGSTDGTAATIKSHHNVGGLPDDMQFSLIEPLKSLFKDEVREVGLALGLPKSMVWRQPFPGPGLAIRILGAVTADRLRMVRDADAILRNEIAAAGLHDTIWQYFTVLAATTKSVGVQGDSRTYAHPIIVRAVTSDDAMTADWARIPPEVLERVSSRITNEVDGVNRVLLDITAKPPGTIEWE